MALKLTLVAAVGLIAVLCFCLIGESRAAEGKGDKRPGPIVKREDNVEEDWAGRDKRSADVDEEPRVKRQGIPGMGGDQMSKARSLLGGATGGGKKGGSSDDGGQQSD